MLFAKNVGKVVGFLALSYMVFNTLVWAVVGSGMGLNYLYSEDLENPIQHSPEEVFEHVFAEGEAGWRKFGRLIKAYVLSL